MNDEASRIYEYTSISKANSKFFQQEFTLTRAARALEIPRVLRFKHADESSQVLSYGYALLTIEIPNKLCTYHRENWKPFEHFWNASTRKASIM